MQKETVLYAVIAFLLGVVLTTGLSAYAVNNNMAGMMRMMGMHPDAADADYGGMMGGGNMTMNRMMYNLRNESGEEFDRTFLSQMIDHHKGAIDMAEEARRKATRQEIKDMASTIIADQQKEVDQMRSWQREWGY